MAIVLELPAELEARLTADAAARGLDLPRYALELLEQAAPAAQVQKPQRTPEEIRAWLDEFAQFSDQIPAMPGETFSREMIYEDHD
jgi:hypothetical protein